MAITKVSDLATPEFTNVITDEMLPRPDDKYVWRDLGLVRDYTDEKGIASVGASNYGRIMVDKPAWVGEGFAEADRRLTDGTDIQTTNLIGLTFDQFNIAVREYAGPYSTATAASIQPLAITEFALRRSIHDLAAWIGTILRRDFLRWQNATFRDQALGTTSLVTGDGTAEGSITAGKVINWDFFLRLKKAMEDLLIPPFQATQRYRFVISTRDETKLPVDADIKLALQNRADLAPEFRSGYIGTVLGFDLYVDTTMPTKGVGAGGAVVGYQGVAWGDVPVLGYVNAKAPEARRYKNDDFERKLLMVWIAHQGFGTLDLNNVCVRTITT